MKIVAHLHPGCRLRLSHAPLCYAALMRQTLSTHNAITRALTLISLSTALIAASARADQSTPLSLGPTNARYTLRADPAAQPDPAPAPKKSTPFGAQGSEWLTVGTGISHDFQGSAGFDAHVSWSTFIVRDVEFSLELAAWYFAQKKQDAAGLNPQMVFRWHFVNNEKWTVFAEAGIGVLVSTDNVPDGGTAFNFTPRAGLGFTRLLTDDGLRLQVGVRWAHISNARIKGDDRNPSRDSAMLYTGLIWPF